MGAAYRQGPLRRLRLRLPWPGAMHRALRPFMSAWQPYVRPSLHLHLPQKLPTLHRAQQRGVPCRMRLRGRTRLLSSAVHCPTAAAVSTQGGGIETTIMTALTQFVHHVRVPGTCGGQSAEVQQLLGLLQHALRSKAGLQAIDATPRRLKLPPICASPWEQCASLGCSSAHRAKTTRHTHAKPRRQPAQLLHKLSAGGVPLCTLPFLQGMIFVPCGEPGMRALFAKVHLQALCAIADCSRAGGGPRAAAAPPRLRCRRLCIRL